MGSDGVVGEDSQQQQQQKQQQAFPMVAVRSAGVGFGSVVGYLDEGFSDSNSSSSSTGDYGDVGDGDGGVVRGLVGEDVLRLMLGVANGRFVENKLRGARFEEGIRRMVERERMRGGGGGDLDGWEDGGERARRMRKEGLAVRDVVQGRKGRGDGDADDDDDELVTSLMDGLEI